MSDKSFLNNVYDSGITQIWFSSLANALLTSAAILVGRQGVPLADLVAFISYFLLGTQLTYGTRGAYEYLKSIYVYSENNGVISFLFHGMLFLLRLHIIFIPVAVYWWAYFNEEVLF